MPFFGKVASSNGSSRSIATLTNYCSPFETFNRSGPFKTFKLRPRPVELSFGEPAKR